MWKEPSNLTDMVRAARYSDLFGDHQRENASDCAYCPICATISVLRDTKPEVVEHLTAAARELVAAAGLIIDEAQILIEGAESKVRVHRASEDGSNVRRIDLG